MWKHSPLAESHLGISLSPFSLVVHWRRPKLENHYNQHCGMLKRAVTTIDLEMLHLYIYMYICHRYLLRHSRIFFQSVGTETFVLNSVYRGPETNVIAVSESTWKLLGMNFTPPWFAFSVCLLRTTNKTVEICVLYRRNFHLSRFYSVRVGGCLSLHGRSCTSESRELPW